MLCSQKCPQVLCYRLWLLPASTMHLQLSSFFTSSIIKKWSIHSCHISSSHLAGSVFGPSNFEGRMTHTFLWGYLKFHLSRRTSFYYQRCLQTWTDYTLTPVSIIIRNIGVFLLLTLIIFFTSVCPEQRSDPGRKHLTSGSPSGFLFFPRRVFPDEVEGLTIQSTDLQDLQGQQHLGFEAQHKFYLIWLWSIFNGVGI